MIRLGYVSGSQEQEPISLKSAAKKALGFRIRFFGMGILACGSMQI